MSATEPETRQLQLAENLDLTAAGPLHETLLSMRGEDLVVDAASVERLGGQCVWLLLSARQNWAEDDVAFAIENPSQNFLSALAILGVEPGSLNVKEEL